MTELPFALKMYPTGSRFICNPPVYDTDIDYVVLVDKGSYELDNYLEDQGYITNWEDYPIDEFRSYKLGELNYIITDVPDFYDKYVEATKLARKLNLLKKQQRIDLFDYVMYNENNK